MERPHSECRGWHSVGSRRDDLGTEKLITTERLCKDLGCRKVFKSGSNKDEGRVRSVVKRILDQK